jgi:aspartyl-tRNA(Asn)/glutamyl-tRNA(Gln) amidotransferase subunit A
MKTGQICYLTIAQAAELIRGGELSPVELTQAYLDRISLIDPTLRTYITISADVALAQAHEAAAEIAQGRYRGPLHGIPISYKDLIETAGIRTTASSRIYADFIPEKNAAVVARLRESGAITLGKATLNEFAFSGISEDDFIKAARNPWNQQCPTGLSSSGSAAGVAAGLAMASIATDSGGSIRIPASYCGVSGLKPTYGLISRTGVMPLSYSLDHVGTIARTAQDTALLLESLAGHDPQDLASSKQVVPAYSKLLTGPIRGLRIGICPQYMQQVGVEDRVWEAFQHALDEFRSLGMTLSEIRLPNFGYAPAANFTLLRIEGFRVHSGHLKEHRDKYGLSAFREIAVGGLLSASDYLRSQQARTLLSSELSRAFQGIDLLLIPSTPSSAAGGTYHLQPPLDQKVAKDDVSYVAPFDLTGTPALSICCGFTPEGLPIGLQLIGRAFDEGTILRVAHRYQGVTDFHRRKPPLEIAATASTPQRGSN